ncbi:MAG: hypothetical protein V1875_01775 [Candidatus Altiarchaeota archaeon]
MKTRTVLIGNTKLVFGVIILIAILAVFDTRFRTGVTFIILILLTIIAVISSTNKDAEWSIERRNKGEKGALTLDGKEKKYLIFYILNQLRKRETMEMTEIATELNISIYDLTEVLKLLDKHKAVEVIYSPPHNFPIIRRGNQDKSKAYMMSIYKEFAKRSLMGGEMMDEFAVEVNDYIHNMRR